MQIAAKPLKGQAGLVCQRNRLRLEPWHDKLPVFVLQGAICAAGQSEHIKEHVGSFCSFFLLFDLTTRVRRMDNVNCPV
jgi:hypothetical protein